LERRRKWPEEIKRRWLKSERAIVANLDLRDVYRNVHEAGQPFPASHSTGRYAQTTRHRYDYIFASSEFETLGCRYLTKWLEDEHQGGPLSDHTAVVADLRLQRGIS
jgi:endonuclease/exonuclease/phosphatase family metal-dependent hydrolase